jgi:predicted nucleic acid-binding protein
MILADTDVLIDFLNGAEPGAGRVAQAAETGALQTTAITRFELLVGARSEQELGAIDALLGAIPTLSVGEEAAEHGARIQRQLQRAGQSIGMADSLIAGTALAHSASLLTRNRKHFSRIQGLRLAD